MSYSTDPIEDAARHFEPLYRAAKAQEQAEADMAAAFKAACQRADANALCDFAQVTDWSRVKLHTVSVENAGHLPKRQCTLTEVMSESLDFTTGPAMAEAMQLILNVAYTGNLASAPAQARNLLARMAAAYARAHAEAE